MINEIWEVLELSNGVWHETYTENNNRKTIDFYMLYTENEKIIYFNDIKSKKNTKV